MKQVIPGLWLLDEIGSYVNCYLWQWEEGATLIDTGFPKDAHIILETLRRNGYPLHTIKRIIVTHVDLDHTGGLAAIKRATQAPVACHAVERQYMIQPSRRQPAAWYIRPAYWLLTGMPGYQFRPAMPDELLVDGQTLPEGFTVIHTPGHTPGHICLLHKEKRLLITGDVLSNRGNKLRSAHFLYTPDMNNALRSVWRLLKKHGEDFDIMAFGHGPPITQNGSKRVQGLMSKIFAQEV